MGNIWYGTWVFCLRSPSSHLRKLIDHTVLVIALQVSYLRSLIIEVKSHLVGEIVTQADMATGASLGEHDASSFWYRDMSTKSKRTGLLEEGGTVTLIASEEG